MRSDRAKWRDSWVDLRDPGDPGAQLGDSWVGRARRLRSDGMCQPQLAGVFMPSIGWEGKGEGMVNGRGGGVWDTVGWDRALAPCMLRCGTHVRTHDPHFESTLGRTWLHFHLPFTRLGVALPVSLAQGAT